jgi:beta-lactamase regulating signal transducer with metallopeptidase domain
MNSIFYSPMSRIFAESILHSFWQFSLLGLIYFVLLKSKKSISITNQFNIGLATILAGWILFIGNIVFFTLENGVISTKGVHHFSPSASKIYNLESLGINWIEKYYPYVCTIWTIGFAILGLRIVFGLSFLKWIKLNSTLVSSCDTKVNEISEYIGLKRSVKIFESPYVKSPYTVGWWKPVILFPVGLISEIPITYLDAILAHELAHIRRSDYLKQLFIGITEAFFFYHPVVWWLSNQMNTQREIICDDISLMYVKDGSILAKALLYLQERNQEVPKFALGAIGKNKNLTLIRIKKILMKTNPHPSSERVYSLALVALFLLGIALPNAESLSLSLNKVSNLVKETVNEVKENVVATISGNENEKNEIGKSEFESALDTVPKKDVSKIVINQNGNSTIIEMEDGILLNFVKSNGGKSTIYKTNNGEIEKLIIDGKLIDKSEYPNRKLDIEKLIAEAKSNLPKNSSRIESTGSTVIVNGKVVSTSDGKNNVSIIETEDISDPKRGEIRIVTKDGKGNKSVIVRNFDRAQTKEFSIDTLITINKNEKGEWVEEMTFKFSDEDMPPIPSMPPMPPMPPMSPMSPMIAMPPMPPMPSFPMLSGQPTEKEMKAYEKVMKQYEKSMKTYEKMMEKHQKSMEKLEKDLHQKMEKINRDSKN